MLIFLAAEMSCVHAACLSVGVIDLWILEFIENVHLSHGALITVLHLIKIAG